MRNTVHEPFREVNWKNISHWDSYYYLYLKENGYGCNAQGECPDVVFNFFPLTSWLWQIVSPGPVETVIFDFILFALCWALLVYVVVPAGGLRLLVYAMGLLLPIAYVFSFPYSETGFFFSGTIALLGIYRGNRPLTFAGLVLLALSRPVLFIIGPAIVGAELLAWFRQRQHLHSVGRMIERLAALALGTGIVLLIQHSYSGEWFKFFSVHQKYWLHELTLPWPIADWSTEGFAMTLFSYSFVVIPLCVYLLFRLTGKYGNQNNPQPPEEGRLWAIDFSALYVVGAFTFVFLFQGGTLAGIARYTMATPFFYLLLAAFVPMLNRLHLGRLKLPVLAGICLIHFLVLHIAIPYGNKNILALTSWGGLISILFVAYYFLFQYLKPRYRPYLLLSGIVLVPAALFWHVYMLNCLLCDGWIAT